MKNRFLLIAGVGVFFANSALAQERQWNLDATGEDAFLVFGVPQSDDVGVSFWCKLGSKKLKLFAPIPQDKVKDNAMIKFIGVVDGKNYALRGRASITEASGNPNVETELSTDDPMIDSLQKADRFSLTVGSHKSTFPLTDADLPALLKLCDDPPSE